MTLAFYLAAYGKFRDHFSRRKRKTRAAGLLTQKSSILFLTRAAGRAETVPSLCRAKDWPHERAIVSARVQGWGDESITTGTVYTSIARPARAAIYSCNQR